jgi:hypothetical protein
VGFWWFAWSQATTGHAHHQQRGDRLRGQTYQDPENGEKPIAPILEIALEESFLLLTVDRIVGGIEVEHDLLGRLVV